MAGTTIEFLGMRLPTMETLCLCLFIGAMGKWAQFASTSGCRTPWPARRRSRP